MLHFDAAPVVTSNPFSVNGKHLLSRNREMLGDWPTRAARHRPWPGALSAGVDRQAKRRAGASEQNVRRAASCDRVSRYHDREREAQLGRPIMRKLITTIALLALFDTSVAIAQTVGSRNRAAPPSTNTGQQLLPEAPVGHRQPRADQVPSEKNLMDPNDPINQENAALDHMINGICRGC